MGSLGNSEDPDETFCGISLGSALFAKTKTNFRYSNT